MARRYEEDLPEVYIIPDNFIKTGYVLNGNVKSRHLVEGILLALAVALLCWNLPIQSFSTKLSATLTISMPFLLLGVVGINGDPLSVFLLTALRWYEGKRIMLFNGNATPHDVRAIDVTIAQTTAQSKLRGAMSGLSANRDKDKEQAVLVEGEDFIFEEDADLKRLLSQTETPIDKRTQKLAAKAADKLRRKEEKQARKKKKNDAPAGDEKPDTIPLESETPSHLDENDGQRDAVTEPVQDAPDTPDVSDKAAEATDSEGEEETVQQEQPETEAPAEEVQQDPQPLPEQEPVTQVQEAETEIEAEAELLDDEDILVAEETETFGG